MSSTRSPTRESRDVSLDSSDQVSSPASHRYVSGRGVNKELDPLLSRSADQEYHYTSGNKKNQPNRRRSDESSIQAIPMHTSTSYDLQSNLARTPDGGRSQDQTVSRYQPATRRDPVGWNTLLPYYLPILSWLPNYSVSHFLGDLVGGVSLASFQIPLAISYSISLAKVPLACGLISLAFLPIIYCIFGSVPQMIVGPEAPISLIVGQAVEAVLHHHKKKKIDPVDLVCAITIVSGSTLLGFGLGRLGFLDNVLCESLLKGFICGVGIVMIINSSISMLGLNDLLDQVHRDADEIDIVTPFDRVRFLFAHFNKYHPLTLKVSLVTLLSILVVRFFKSYAAKSKTRHLHNAVYIPEILIAVVATTVLCSSYRWNHKGLEIVGSLENVSKGIVLLNPLQRSKWKLIRKLASSGFVCAMLGFFESTTASKSLGSRYNLPISSNRELVALGAINVVGSFLGALPAFGGYGRSKVNAMSAKTTVSGAIMGILTFITYNSILEYLRFIPKCVLSVITTVIGILLISETPYELYFHWRSQGFDELVTFLITVSATLFFSMEAGIAVGLGYLLVRVIRNSTLSRIQILGRVPGTNTFLDADLQVETNRDDEIDEASIQSANLEHQEKVSRQLNLFTDNFRPLNYQALEEIEGCLIIRIPEPLTFTNACDLRSRLKRVEMYGSTRAHPALKRSRDTSMTRFIIFDLEDMVFIDSSAANILQSSLASYQERGIKSFFVRVCKKKKLRRRLDRTGIKDLLMRDLDSMLLPFRTKDHDCRSSMLSETLDSTGLATVPIRGAVESPKTPYFEHLRDVLALIDHYKSLHHGQSGSLDV